MNKKDKNLLEQFILEMKYKSQEELLAYYEKQQNLLSSQEFAEARERGVGIVQMLRHEPIHTIMDLGLIEAYHKGDMKSLHEALFTYNRLWFPFHRFMASGKDDENEYVICNNIIEAFAACDTESIIKYCPTSSPVLTKGYKMWFIGYNLILGLLYKDEKRIDKGTQQAEKALTTKLPQFDAAVIAYLLALARQSADQANEQFSVMMSVYRKSGLFKFHDAFLKVFALLPHGLYNMGYFFLSEEEFTKILPPIDTVFWNELAEYQKSVGFVHGAPFIKFSGNLASLNSIYE